METIIGGRMRARISKWINIQIFVIIIFSISGCVELFDKDEDEDPWHENDNIPPRILFQGVTEYGMTNVSYKLLGISIINEELVHRFNISVKVENQNDYLYHMNIHYRTYHGSGSSIMRNDIENEYYFRDYLEHEWLDIWIMFYERGELIWNDNANAYQNRSILKKVQSFSISLIDRNVTEDSYINIYDMDWYFDSEKLDQLRIQFNISSSSEVDVEDIYFHNMLRFNESKRVTSAHVYHNSANNYHTSFFISEEDIEEVQYLLFSVGASNKEGRRSTTDVYWIDDMEAL